MKDALGLELVPCETCGKSTAMTGTKRCDGCWAALRNVLAARTREVSGRAIEVREALDTIAHALDWLPNGHVNCPKTFRESSACSDRCGYDAASAAREAMIKLRTMFKGAP